MPQISPFLWFDNNVAEEAVNFYISVFPNSKITQITRYMEGSPGPVGDVMVIGFELDGKKFAALNGGPEFKFNSSISFVIDCQSQDDVDYYWDKLTADGGEEVACGWLTDKFGISWQVTPGILLKYIADPDTVKAGRAMQSMMGMKKLNIAELTKAFSGD